MGSFLLSRKNLAVWLQLLEMHAIQIFLRCRLSLVYMFVSFSLLKMVQSVAIIEDTLGD